MAGAMTDAQYAANRQRLAEMRTTRGTSSAAVNRLSSALNRERNRRARAGESTTASPNRAR